MDINKKPNLVLATASLMSTVTDKFLRNIIQYNDSNISRLVSKQVCLYVDCTTEALRLDCGFQNNMFNRNVRTAIKQRVEKCVNLRTIDMSNFYLQWLTSLVYSPIPEFLEEIVAVAPNVVKIQSNEIPNWFLTTALGTKLFMQYEPHAALTVTDVIEIVCFCLMTGDEATLERFYAVTMYDINPTASAVFMSSKRNVSDDEVVACLHYTDGASRRVNLNKNQSSDVWEVNDIGRLTYWGSVGCTFCK